MMSQAWLGDNMVPLHSKLVSCASQIWSWQGAMWSTVIIQSQSWFPSVLPMTEHLPHSAAPSVLLSAILLPTRAGASAGYLALASSCLYVSLLFVFPLFCQHWLRGILRFHSVCLQIWNICLLWIIPVFLLSYCQLFSVLIYKIVKPLYNHSKVENVHTRALKNVPEYVPLHSIVRLKITQARPHWGLPSRQRTVACMWSELTGPTSRST